MSPPRTPHACSNRRTRSARIRSRAAQRREGAVMLVVMLILMIATASAAVSVQTSQSELHAAGEARIAMQASYASEAAIMSTIAWIDDLGASGDWAALWAAGQAAPVPNLDQFAEPAIPAGAGRNYAMRSSQTSQIPQINPAVEMPPLGAPNTTATIPDLYGSFGPRQVYQPMPFVVDITDCAPAPVALTPGMPVGSGPGSFQQFSCSLTARTRIQLPAANQVVAANQRSWTFGAATYVQDPFMSKHDSRAIIITPPVN